MTNREWLNSMSLIDMLYWIKQRGGCFITEHWDESRCDTYDKCYDCLCAWLNEERNS